MASTSLGTIGLSRLIGERMKTRGKGAIIQMGWDQAEQGMAGDSGQLFAASKGRGDGVFQKPRAVLGSRGAGELRSPWLDKDGLGSDGEPRVAAPSCRRIAGRCWGTPDDVSRTVRFLASDAAGFINGQTIPEMAGSDVPNIYSRLHSMRFPQWVPGAPCLANKFIS